jgi:tRNA pseudouridine55 synthase
MKPLLGVLPVDKPEGPTSHDVVATARRALRSRRIGHTGTLDPFASGLLLLCVGSATRLAEYLTALPKTYVATMRLGTVTDTDDLSGRVLATGEKWRDLTETEIREALERQVGEVLQLPPLYSAKKVQGERMYAAARRGEEVARTPAAVTIHRLEPLEIRLPDVTFAVECSSGTYVRAIARDVGEQLGVGGHLTRLRRTRIGEHRVEGALSPDQLGDEAVVARALISPARAVAHLPGIPLDEAAVGVVRHGGTLPAPSPADAPGPVALLSLNGELVGIGEVRDDRLHPRKVLV